MTHDTMTYQFHDPAHRWSTLLDGLNRRQRDAMVAALRQSDESGFPATAEGVRILVAYAQGQITAQQYATQMSIALGQRLQPTLEPGPPAPPVVAQTPAPMSAASKRVSRDEAVQAYVSGRITVEEFLRLSRVRSA